MRRGDGTEAIALRFHRHRQEGIMVASFVLCCLDCGRVIGTIYHKNVPVRCRECTEAAKKEADSAPKHNS